MVKSSDEQGQHYLQGKLMALGASAWAPVLAAAIERLPVGRWLGKKEVAMKARI